MASAFQPSTVISNINIEAPDFSIMAKAAEAVQGRYYAGFNKAKSYYNSLLNSRLSVGDNEQFRNEFFKKADDYLNNLGGVDFSNPGNVVTATKLFDPLVKDKEFAYDLNWSMQQASEQQKLEQTRTSNDEKIRTQYSPTMQAAMNYSIEDMRSSKRGDGSIFKTPVQRFVPFQNLQNILNEAADKLNLEVKIDRTSGFYIITDKNGQNAIPRFTQWARDQLGNTYDEQLLVMAKVGVRQQLDAIMKGNPNISKEDAYQQVAKQNALGIYENYNEYKNSINSGIEAIDKKLRDLKSQYKNGLIPNELVPQVQQLKQVRAQYQKELADGKQNTGDRDKDLQTAFQQFMQNPEYALLPVYKDGIAKAWGSDYAMAKEGRDIQVDSSKIELQREAWESAMAEKKHGWDLELQDKKAKADLNLELFKQKITLGSISTAPAQPVGTSDPNSIYNRDKASTLDKAFGGYLNQSVLEVAASSANLTQDVADPVSITNAIQDVMSRFDRYGSNPAADPTFLNNYNLTLKYLKKVNPNISRISNVGQIMQTISDGVNRSSYQDVSKLQEAKSALSIGQENFNRWAELDKNEKSRYAAFKSSGYFNYNYIDKNAWEQYGKIVIKAGVSDADKMAMSDILTPNIELYKGKTAENKTGWAINGDDTKFNFGAIDEAIQNATKASILAEDNGGIANAFNEDILKQIKLELSSAGGTLKDIFTSQGIQVHEVTGPDGLQYAKVDLGVKKGEKGVSKIPSLGSQGALSLYVPANTFRKMWQSMGTVNIGGVSVNVPVYGDLSQIPGKLFKTSNPVSWIHDGLRGGSVAQIPDYLVTRYHIQGGSLVFSTVPGQEYLQFTVQANNKKNSMRIPSPNGGDLTIAEYNSDPAAYSEYISQGVIKQLKDINDAIVSNMRSKADNHSVSSTQNPSGYTKIDDIK